jgi:hypothetical protein
MTTLKHIHALAIALICSITAMAEIPAGYYNSLNGKSDAALKTAVYNITRNFIYPSTDANYATTYTNLRNTFQKTDVRPESNRWWDMYSNIPFYAPSFSGLNREHSLPKSWWGGALNVPAYIDLNHLYPSEQAANTAKLNYPLGVVDTSKTVSFDNGVSKVGYPVTGQGGNAAYVFEPDDEYKGDFARTYFYMATTYQDYTWKYTYMLTNNTYPTLQGWAIDLLLEWSRNDQVSEKEQLRNEAVYQIQNNRNPFIDYPNLAEYIWGNRKGQAFDISDTSSDATGTPNLITPVQGTDLDFGEVAIGSSVTSKIFFHGEYLSGDIKVRIYKGDKDMFSIGGESSASIASSLINNADGYWLTMTYKPTALGDHSARIVITGSGITGSIGMELRGSCLEVPTLSACTATAASDITATSYVANWTAPQDEVVDYYIVTRTMYKDAVATSEELLAETDQLTIDGFDQYDSETYSVQSVRLGYRSPMSNVITVSHSNSVSGITVDEPLAIVNIEGAIRFICSTPHTGVQIFDTTGRCVKQISQVDNNTDIEMPGGVYIITTDQCHRPVKAIVR